MRLRPLLALLAVPLVAVGVGVAYAAGPGDDRPAWVVSVGDSYIAGQAGRWAGNADNPAATDALGPDAYSGGGCDRSRSAEIVIGVVQSLNLACSGARVTSTGSGDSFTPGLDFADGGAGRLGQAAQLRDFARTHRVTMVAVSIGGNDAGFATVAQRCVEDFLLSPSWLQHHCSADSSVTDRFTPAALTTLTARVRGALDNLHQAMRDAGYADSAYTILAQTYPTPVPPGAQFRYSQKSIARQSVGGCGLWNADADYANTTIVPGINSAVRAAAGQANARIVDVSGLFDGHRLCEQTDHKLQETRFTSWSQPGAVDVSEWVENVRTVTAALGPYTVAESLHPNYWGQLALRNCLRQAYDDGHPHGGTCRTTGTGLTERGEPVTTLT